MVVDGDGGQVLVLSEDTMDYWITLIDRIDIDLAAKTAQRFHRQVNAFADVFGVSRVDRHGRCLNKLAQQLFVFFPMILGKRKKLISLQLFSHSQSSP